jgi:hypothetical protein
METQPKFSDRAYERALHWMESCRDVALRKGAALMRNDLASLEECVDETAELISRRSEVSEITRGARENIEFPGRAAGKALAELAAELRWINRRNAALIEAGLEFSRTMRGAGREYPGLNEPTLSLEC